MSVDERYGVAASDLRGYKVRGFLDKKRPSKKLLSVKYQRRWCVLHDSNLYYFEDPRDRRQKGAFSLIGYKFWHGGGTDNAFSLVARGKRTYDFICPTIEDFERWKEGILSVTENVPSGHEVFVNKTSVGGGSMGRASPSVQRKIVREPSFSSDDSADNMEFSPVRPPPVSRPPRRPPMPPVPRTEKTPVTKKQSEPLDMYSTVNKQQLSRTNTAIPVPTNKPSGWDDDLDDYDVVDHRHPPKNTNKGSGSDEEIYDRPDVGPEPVYATAKHPGIRSDSSSDSDDYSHVSPRTSDYFTPDEIEELRKRTSSGYDKPYELESLRKQSPLSSDADEPSYLSSAEIHGSQRNASPANTNFDSNIASLLGLRIKDQQTDTRNANVGKNNAKKNRKSRKKRHQEEPGLNSVPEDPYMEFVGEGGVFEDGEDQEDLQSSDVQKYSDPEDPYMEFVGEEPLGEEEEEDQDNLHSQGINKVSRAENINESVQKKPLSHLHSLQLELNSKLVKRLQGEEKEETAPRESKQEEEEPLYENFLNINSLETRSLPRDIKMPSTPPLPSHKRKQSSFESNTDSSSDGEFPPVPIFCPVSQ